MKNKKESMSKLALIVKTIDDLKGNDIQVIDVRNVNPLCDYYVICDANNTTQTYAIANHIEDELEKNNYSINHIEGRKERTWVLLDADNIVVHIFYSPERAKYRLDELWADQYFLNEKEIFGD